MAQKTPEEIAELKRQWYADPCWDIEESEGFEDYTAELRQYRVEQEARWRQRASERRAAEMIRLRQRYGLSQNDSLVEVLESMERAIRALQQRVDILEGD